MQVSLLAIKSDGEQVNIPLSTGKTVIGREKGCDLRIPTPEVSRNHCEIHNEGSQIILRDLGSSNGTYMNCQRVSECELVAGDLIALGKVVLVVCVDGEPSGLDSESTYERGMPQVMASMAGASASKREARPSSPSAPTTSLHLGEDDEDDVLSALDVGNEGSSEFDFNLALDDEDDDQPAL